MTKVLNIVPFAMEIDAGKKAHKIVRNVGAGFLVENASKTKKATRFEANPKFLKS